MNPIRWRCGAAGLVVGVALSLHSSQSLAAAAPPIPASLYPAHTHLTTVAPLTNGQMDCAWGFVCRNGQPLTNQPVFHLTTQDALHRLSGRAQFGRSTVSGHPMLFALYASLYRPGGNADDLPGNLRAFADFRLALMVRGYRDIDPVPALTPPGVLANAGLQELHSRRGDVLAMACWTGDIEVEGVAIYAHGMPAQRRLALRDLVRQMRAAIHGLQTQEGSAQ